VSQPLVSTVIPTRNRPRLVTRAVQSAIKQTYQNIEVVVVVDGPDSLTTEALRTITDERLRVIQLPAQVGGSDARNAGVQAARGEWVAFLDDDDEWLANKIEKQVQRARQSRSAAPIVCSQLLAHRDHEDVLIWPRKAPSLPICEYLFSRTSWSFGEGLLSTITLLIPRRLLLEVPFTSGLRKYQDFDWVLRVTSYKPDTLIEFIPEPLAIWHMGTATVSTTDDWKWAWTWIRSQRKQVTARAYSGFIASSVAPQAARQKQWQAFFPLLHDALTQGDPTLFQIVLYFSMWFAPPWVRRLARKRSQGTNKAPVFTPAAKGTAPPLAATQDVPRPSWPCSGAGGAPVAQKLSRPDTNFGNSSEDTLQCDDRSRQEAV